MFDFAWSEIALIAVVALIAIGPKDMPVAIRAVTGWIKKARRMAAEFQTHVDEMVREADLSEVRASINEIRNFDVRGEIERTSIRTARSAAAFASNPLEPSAPAAARRSTEIAVSEPVIEQPEPIAASLWRPQHAVAARRVRPAFVPPNMVRAGGASTLCEPSSRRRFIPPGDRAATPIARPSA